MLISNCHIILWDESSLRGRRLDQEMKQLTQSLIAGEEQALGD